MLTIGALNEPCADESNTVSLFFEVCREEQEAEALSIFNEALSLKKENEFEKAESQFLKVLETDLIQQGAETLCDDELLSENAVLYLKYNVYKHLGEIAEFQENDEKIIQYYLKAALIDESHVCLWWTIGIKAFRQSNLQLARHAFEKGLVCSPTHFPCLDKLIEVLYIIGDYQACLCLISKAFEGHKNYVRGFAFRDQIFKEEFHFKRDCKHLRFLFQDNPRRNKQTYSKIIEDALVVRGKKILLSKDEELTSRKIIKPLQYYNWLNVGENLLSLYREFSEKRDDQSPWLAGSIDLSKYYCKDENQASLPLPSLDSLKKKLINKSPNKDNENKSLKRKKFTPTSSSQESESPPKRRSTRVKLSKNKESDVNWSELIFSYFQDAIKPDDDTQSQDSQESMEVDETQNTPSNISLNEDSLRKESIIVSKFLNANQKNSGIIFVIENYLMELSKEWNIKWMLGLSNVYMSLYQLLVEHSLFPNPFSSQSDVMYLESLARVILLSLEFQLDTCSRKLPRHHSPTNSPSKVESDKLIDLHQFLKDMDFIKHVIFLNRNNIKKDSVFIARFLWIQGRHFLSKSDFKNSKTAFSQCLTKLKDIPDEFVYLPNCQNANMINQENLREKINFLKQNQPVQELEILFSKKKYKEIIENLCQFVFCDYTKKECLNNPDRPHHVLFLLKSYLEMKQYKECFDCVKISLGECLQEMVWQSHINELLKIIYRLLTTNDAMVDVSSNEIKSFILEKIVKIVELTMESESVEWEHITTLPWLVLLQLITLETVQDNEDNAEKIVEFMRTAHEYLGKKHWCCEDDGLLLLTFVNVMKKYLKDKSTDTSFIESLSYDLEQCFYCLFANPCKKSKSKYLQDHTGKPITLTWDNSKILYEFYKPDELPVIDLKVNTISVEIQHVFRKILTVAPASKIEVIPFATLQQYIEGTQELPVIEYNQEKFENCIGMHDIFYYLGDFYFKNKEFNKALKYYMHDVSIQPRRFQSWAAMAITRGSKLEEKINQYDDKGESIIRKHVISTLRCFKKALSFNSNKCVLYEEYGQAAYMLHSFISRKKRQERLGEYRCSPQKESFPVSQKEMLVLAESCSNKALELASSKGVDEWLHLYMLGKTAEHLQQKPEVYFDYYQKCLKELYENGAVLIKKIPYHGAPHHAIESIEIFYRMYTCILKLLPNFTHAQYTILEEQLNKLLEQKIYIESQDSDQDTVDVTSKKTTVGSIVSSIVTTKSIASITRTPSSVIPPIDQDITNVVTKSSTSQSTVVQSNKTVFESPILIDAPNSSSTIATSKGLYSLGPPVSRISIKENNSTTSSLCFNDITLPNLKGGDEDNKSDVSGVNLSEEKKANQDDISLETSDSSSQIFQSVSNVETDQDDSMEVECSQEIPPKQATNDLVISAIVNEMVGSVVSLLNKKDISQTESGENPIHSENQQHYALVVSNDQTNKEISLDLLRETTEQLVNTLNNTCTDNIGKNVYDSIAFTDKDACEILTKEKSTDLNIPIISSANRFKGNQTDSISSSSNATFLEIFKECKTNSTIIKDVSLQDAGEQKIKSISLTDNDNISSVKPLENSALSMLMLERNQLYVKKENLPKSINSSISAEILPVENPNQKENFEVSDVDSEKQNEFHSSTKKFKDNSSKCITENEAHSILKDSHISGNMISSNNKTFSDSPIEHLMESPIPIPKDDQPVSDQKNDALEVNTNNDKSILDPQQNLSKSESPIIPSVNTLLNINKKSEEVSIPTIESQVNSITVQDNLESITSKNRKRSSGETESVSENSDPNFVNVELSENKVSKNDNSLFINPTENSSQNVTTITKDNSVVHYNENQYKKINTMGSSDASTGDLSKSENAISKVITTKPDNSSSTVNLPKSVTFEAKNSFPEFRTTKPDDSSSVNLPEIVISDDFYTVQYRKENPIETASINNGSTSVSSTKDLSELTNSSVNENIRKPVENRPTALLSSIHTVETKSEFHLINEAPKESVADIPTVSEFPIAKESPQESVEDNSAEPLSRANNYNTYLHSTETNVSILKENKQEAPEERPTKQLVISSKQVDNNDEIESDISTNDKTHATCSIEKRILSDSIPSTSIEISGEKTTPEKGLSETKGDLKLAYVIENQCNLVMENRSLDNNDIDKLKESINEELKEEEDNDVDRTVAMVIKQLVDTVSHTETKTDINTLFQPTKEKVGTKRNRLHDKINELFSIKSSASTVNTSDIVDQNVEQGIHSSKRARYETIKDNVHITKSKDDIGISDFSEKANSSFQPDKGDIFSTVSIVLEHLIQSIELTENNLQQPISSLSDQLVGNNNESTFRQPISFSKSTRDQTKNESRALSRESLQKENVEKSRDPKERYKVIANRCLQGLTFSLRKFPEHYKSQYTMARFLAYDPILMNLEWSRDLLIGASGEERQYSITLPVHGLFSLKKKTNMFQYLWRIPVPEIDRPGSFCSHLFKAVNLLLHVLKELKDFKHLFHVSSFLNKTPDKDRKYLRDNDRAYLANKALSYTVEVLGVLLKNSSDCDEITIQEYYDVYRHAQKLQKHVSESENLLIKFYRSMTKQHSELGETDRTKELDAAIKYCTKAKIIS